jgi:prevent-host-death family protein
MSTKQFSIAQARARLAEIVRAVERGLRVELTRRGKPVVVLLSPEEYGRISNGSTTFEKAYEEFRNRFDLEALNLSPDLFEGLRDRSPGREVHP